MAIKYGQNEKAVKRKVTAALKKHGAWYTLPHQRGYSQTGVPDVLACCRGSFVAIECKSGSNQVTPRQQLQLDEITAAGGVSFVVNEGTLPLFEAFLERLYESSGGV